MQLPHFVAGLAAGRHHCQRFAPTCCLPRTPSERAYSVLRLLTPATTRHARSLAAALYCRACARQCRVRARMRV
eukprot:5483459-Alexandrium_andersonii.AAC.1